jgi:iron complex outermembrane receptor protein/vitamin B12 transporter
MQRRVLLGVAWALSLVVSSTDLRAERQASVTGVVVDQLGGRVAAATVTLLGEHGPAGQATSGQDGVYSMQVPTPGRYRIAVQATSFEPFESDLHFVGNGSPTTIDARLQIGPLAQSIVVTASAPDVPQAQTGASVTVIDQDTLAAINSRDLLEALRRIPGSQMVQVGGKGGPASLFIRGGNSNFNKILVDGIPVNDIGGGFDFAQVSTSGVDRVEVLRGTNSVRYGTDALSGVVSIATRRGRTGVPLVDYSLDGGNLGTVTTEAALGGAVNRFDYFSSYSHADTDNQIPNNHYLNGTYAGRFGVALGGGSDLSASIRRTDTRYGSPNAILFFGVPAAAKEDKDQTFFAAALRSQWTDRWQSTVRFGVTDEHAIFDDLVPTGEAYDPFGFGAVYLGDQVTIDGANGYSATGRGVLSFGGFITDNRVKRKLLSGDATYDVSSALAITAGARYEHEEGFDVPADITDEPAVTRNNGGVFIEGRSTLMNRHYISAGLGYEHNAVFDSAVTPRVSIASYLRQPSASGLGETKLTFNAGTGIKAPSVFQEQNALLTVLEGTPAGGTVGPIGPERSRTIDVGIEQGFWGGQARARVAYFHNTFTDLLEGLGVDALVRSGVPLEAAAEAGFAYVNAASFRARGVETVLEMAIGRRLRVMGSYTFLDAEVTDAFGASTSFNPLFPGIPIGAFQALVGERPFRRPTNSGSFMVVYSRDKAQVALSGYLAGKRDDSTFLSDQDFGNTMLLPNQDLADSYQKIDLSASYQVHRRLRGYVSIENLLDQDYQPAFGFPALPLAARAGFRLTLGGD